MDLVVRKAEAPAADPPANAAAHEMPTVTVPDAVVSQLGVRTTKVRRGTLARNVEGFGAFLRTTARGYRPVYGGTGTRPERR